MRSSRLFLSVAALLVVSPGLRAQTAAAAPPTPNTVAVTAQGEVEVAPDVAIVQLNVSGQNPGLKEAYAQAQAQAERVRGILGQQGFTPDQVQWTGYYVNPETDYKSHKVVQYTVSVRATLRTSDFSKVGALLGAFGESGVNALDSVRFDLKDPGAAKAAAVAAAYRAARTEAEALAQAAGRRIESLISASVDASQAGIVRPLEMRALAAVPPPTSGFSPAPIAVTASVHAVYRINP